MSMSLCFYVSMLPEFRKGKTKLTETSNFRLFAENGNGFYLFAASGKGYGNLFSLGQQTINNNRLCCFSKHAHLCI